MDFDAIQTLLIYPLLLIGVLAGLYTFMVNLIAHIIVNWQERNTLPCYSNAPLYLTILACLIAYCPSCLSKAIQDNPDGVYVMYQVNQAVSNHPAVVEAQQQMAYLSARPAYHVHRRHHR